MAFLRAREVEEKFKSLGPERGSLWCMQTLAEQQIALQKDVRDLAELVNQMTDIVSQFSVVGENMKTALDNLNSQGLYEDGHGKNTHVMGTDDDE